jgi:phosphopantetheinyl transferase
MGATLRRHLARERFIAVGMIYPRDLDDTALSLAVSQLSADECAHVQQLRHRTKRLEVVCGRLLVRHILAQLLGTSPSLLMFRVGRYGKPYLAQRSERSADAADAARALSFNLAHAGNHILLGCSQLGEIGVDIEDIEAYRADIARQYFHQDEYHDLEELPAAERPRAFTRLWTAKEACVKAMGVGLRYPLSAVHVTSEDTGRSAGVTWRRLDCGPGIEAVVALRRRDRSALLHEDHEDHEDQAGTLFWLPMARLLSV